MQLLARRKFSGFVPYPKNWPKRIICGKATYQTKCDMLVGPCACGYIHRECDGWVQEYLEEFNAEIEPLVLVPKNGEIILPKYWNREVYNNKYCSHLIGPCSCGTIHRLGDPRTHKLLDTYIAVIHETILQTG